MDTGLRLVVEQCTRIICSYQESIGDDELRFHAAELVHLIQAKLSLQKCLLVSDKYNFNIHKLTRVYDDQLQAIRERFKPSE